MPLGLQAALTHALQYPTATRAVLLHVDLAALVGVGQ